MSARERRLVFGEVAELYDAARPTYPDALVADLATWARAAGDPPGAGWALEVGAGTGKATRLLQAAGVAVHAIEPDPEMAAIARRSTERGTVAVTVEVADFEHAALSGRSFSLVYSAQAWHWVTQPRGYELAREVLEPGGRLAAFWNRPAWERSPLREDLNAVYEAHVPAELRGGPLHPVADGTSLFDGEDWEAEIADVAGFAGAEVRGYDWSLGYTARSYADMLGTISEVRLLDDARRAAFLRATREAITAHGGAFTLAMQTRTCVARAV